MDGEYTQRYQSPTTCHAPQEVPVQDITLTAPAPGTEPTRSPEEEARDILATAAKNQAEDGPNTRRAAVRACKYLRAMVNQYESTIQEVHKAARTHTQMSKGTVGAPVDYRPQGGALPVISPRTHFRVTALSVHATRPMAPGQNSH